MWHDVPNRGGRITIVLAERNYGDVGLSSGWQGDNSGNTAPGPNNDYVTVPIARNADGSAITGLVLGRIVNASGIGSQPLICSYQSGAVQTGELGHDEGDSHDAYLRKHRRRDRRRRHGPERQLGLGQVRCWQPISRHTRPDANLREGRLRSEIALSGGVHRAGSLRAWNRLCRVSRYGFFFQE